MEPEDHPEEDGPFSPWLPPEDRLWRHPSEMAGGGGFRAAAVAAAVDPGWARPWGVALCAGAIGAVLAFGVGLVTGVVGHRTVVETVHVPTPDTTAVVADSSGSAGNWAAIADSLAPSVVSLRIATSSGVDLCSGVIYAASRKVSYIITAADAVSGGRMTVTFDDGRSEPAKPVGTDPASGVALVAVAGDHGQVPPIGSVSNLQIADPLLAVGARAGGGGLAPVATGTATGVDQQLQSSGGETLYGMLAVGNLTLPDGADGGALVDAQGAVVGIDTGLTAADPQEQGTAFAIPIDTAERVANQMLAGRAPSHPWIGINNATDISSATAQELGIAGGAEVASVAAGSPAALAGLRVNDVVTAFDGKPVASSGSLVMLLAHCQPGDRASISYLASGHLRTGWLSVTRAPAGGG